MARTYALIGTRPDIGGVLARAQLASVWPPRDRPSNWGLGFFDKDEVLLKRGPGSPVASLLANIGSARSHAFLSHESDEGEELTQGESMPPLRYGNILFSAQGRVEPVKLLMGPAKVLLPEFLTRVLRGETFAELAFALFLSELPTGSLARSRLQEPHGSTDPLQPENLKKALRKSLTTLDQLCKAQGLERFEGSLWIQTGELLMVAHRGGSLSLQVIRGSKDLALLHIFGESSPHGLDQAQFVALCAGSDQSGVGWERIPDKVLLTVKRGEVPQTESL